MSFPSFSNGIDVSVNDAILASHTDNLADNTEFNQQVGDVEHEWGISTADGTHTDITAASLTMAGNIDLAGNDLVLAGDSYLHEAAADQVALVVGGAEMLRVTTTGLGVGTSAPEAIVQILGTTEQLRISYDADVDWPINVDSVGAVTLGQKVSYYNTITAQSRVGNPGGYQLTLSPDVKPPTARPTNAGGLKISPTITASISGTEVTNFHGIYIEDYSGTGAATNEWGIYQAGTADNYFGGSVGINTTGPDRRLDVLDASNPQIRWTHTDGTHYGEVQADGSGYTTFIASGNRWGFGAAPSIGRTVEIQSANGGLWVEDDDEIDTRFMVNNGVGLRISAAGTVTALSAEKDGSGSYGDMQFWTSNTNRLTIASGGAITVATATTFQSTVTIDSASTAEFKADAATDSNSVYYWSENGTVRYGAYYDASNNRWALYTDDSDGGGTDADVIRIPDGQLSVDGNSTFDDDAFDYVCESCGWHGAEKVAACPRCGALDVHWHDDVALMDRIVHIDWRHDRGLSRKMERLGLWSFYGSLDTDRPERFTSLNRMPDFLMSGLVQERQRAERTENALRVEIATLKAQMATLAT